VSAADLAPPQRLPAGVRLAILESPLSAELRQIAALGVPVIVIAERAEPEDRLRASQLGASDLLAKNASLAELSLSIRKAFERPAPERRLYELTPRQREVLRLIVEGLDNRAIADQLEISERTARAHVSGVLRKLGAANRTQAAVTAVQRGLVGLLVLLAVSTTVGSGAADAAAAPRAAALKGKVSYLMRVAGGRSSAWIYDVDARKRLLDWNGARKLTPASVEKLFTASTALNGYGPDARLETTVLATGVVTDGVLDGSLYVKGAGDPSFDTGSLAQLADLVAGAGIDHVTGRVYGDESYFDSRRGGPSTGFATSSYVGPLSALAFNHGTIAPVGHGFQTDPPRFVAERLEAGLRRRDVTVDRAARTARAPADARIVASVASPTLAALVRHMNVFSDNYYAETLVKGLGARFGSAGSTTAGAAVVLKFAESRGISSRVVDGSGLSRANSVSPRAVGRLLLSVEDEPWFDALYRSLPLAGVSGTLHKRMRGTSAAGRCRAKTGTLISVSALAGYCRSSSDHRIAFALLMNRVNVTAARRVQDRIAAALAAYRP
jgi:D-alanyl-D-alanine carboxypeptidase/D-alanyl-D-alanine-endopeptidase (penicillin-binding protein 4)